MTAGERQPLTDPLDLVRAWLDPSRPDVNIIGQPREIAAAVAAVLARAVTAEAALREARTDILLAHQRFPARGDAWIESARLRVRGDLARTAERIRLTCPCACEDADWDVHDEGCAVSGVSDTREAGRHEDDQEGATAMQSPVETEPFDAVDALVLLHEEVEMVKQARETIAYAIREIRAGDVSEESVIELLEDARDDLEVPPDALDAAKLGGTLYPVLNARTAAADDPEPFTPETHFVPEGDARCGFVMDACTCMKRKGHDGLHACAHGGWRAGPGSRDTKEAGQ